MPLHGLQGRQGSSVAQSNQTGRSLGRADGTTSREILKEKLLSRKSQLPRPVVTLCGHQPSSVARVTQDIRLPRLQAEGRRDSPEKQKREALVGTVCGKTPLCHVILPVCSLFGQQLSEDGELISLQAHPVAFTSSQEDKIHNLKVNLGIGSGRRASIKFLNQVNLGNPHSATQ